MNIYKTKVLPFLIEKICSGGDFLSLREKKLKGISGIGLEVGAGVGLNFKYYPDNISRLYIIEPCLTALNKAIKASEIAAYPIESLAYLENGSIPLKDESLDFLVSTWTLCSIRDLKQFLLEAKRVLKQEGEFYFIEHGLSPEPKIALAQNILNPVQKLVGGGCHLNRKIDEAFLQAGFKIDSLTNFYMPGPRIGSYLYSGIASKN